MTSHTPQRGITLWRLMIAIGLPSATNLIIIIICFITQFFNAAHRIGTYYFIQSGKTSSISWSLSSKPCIPFSLATSDPNNSII